MSDKSTFNKCRDALQQGIYAVINPFVRLLIKMGVTPNIVTTIGLLGNAAATAVLIYATMQLAVSGPDYGMLTLAGALIIGFSLFDMLDGQVARLGGMTSTFGALYDSVLDRYCEMLTLGGIAFFLLGIGSIWGALITFLALIGSVMVSYVRARAEGLDIECKVGLMQRPERVVVTAIALIAAGIAKEPMVLIVAMGIIAVLANLTAFWRVAHCHRQLSRKNNTANKTI
ncbi:MAG: CDP-alcohol phosphatidyltransferase family protein [Muribaculaceae bacterium]